MAGITILMIVVSWYTAMALGFMRPPTRLAPEVRAELVRLVEQHQTERMFALVDEQRQRHLQTQSFSYLVCVGLISAAIGGALGLALARRISLPITAVANAATQVAAGDNSVRVDVSNTAGELRVLVQNFNVMATAIDVLERERNILTAGIAHEIRTPLTIIGGRLHAAIDGLIDPGPDESRHLLRQVNHMTRLVDDLRTLAHAEAGELTLDVKRINPADTVQAVMTDFQPSAERVGVTIVGSFVSTRIDADVDRLYQILANLVTNAIKYSPSGGLIRIVMERRNGSVRISVCDDGPGLSDSDRAHVFDPFWRGKASIASGRGGSGLGLALAMRLTQAHGGTLTINPHAEGRGATFALSLPLAG